MEKWTEFKTAYRLAKLGTLSATAKDLGIHRSTVMRQIDVLEERLGVKLFQRNDKGYIATEAGLEVMRLGEITDVQFTQFANRAKSKEDVFAGTIKVTCVNEWIHDHVAEENISVSSTSQQILDYAMHTGAGIGISTKETIQNNNQLFHARSVTL